MDSIIEFFEESENFLISREYCLKILYNILQEDNELCFYSVMNRNLIERIN